MAAKMGQKMSIHSGRGMMMKSNTKNKRFHLMMMNSFSFTFCCFSSTAYCPLGAVVKILCHQLGCFCACGWAMVHQRVPTALESVLCCRAKGTKIYKNNRTKWKQAANCKLQRGKPKLSERFRKVQNNSNANQLNSSNYCRNWLLCQFNEFISY